MGEDTWFMSMLVTKGRMGVGSGLKESVGCGVVNRMREMSERWSCRANNRMTSRDCSTWSKASSNRTFQNHFHFGVGRAAQTAAQTRAEGPNKVRVVDFT